MIRDVIYPLNPEERAKEFCDFAAVEVKRVTDAHRCEINPFHRR